MNKNRLLDKLEHKISASVGHRVDLQFADARRINRNSAHFMLAYNESVPSSPEITDFFSRKFDFKITPFLSTAKVYKDKKVVTIIAQVLNLTREVTDIKSNKMRPVIQGAVYLDVDLNETWNIEDREDGKVLVRNVKDDIMALVQARKKSMLDSRAEKTFASFSQADLLKYLTNLEKGDQVRVLVDDKVVDAEVVAVSDAQVKVKTKKGVTNVDRQSIVDVVAKSADKEDKMLNDAEDYFTEAFGDPEYAKQLTTK